MMGRNPPPPATYLKGEWYVSPAGAAGVAGGESPQTGRVAAMKTGTT